jgi:hypothetical protein
LKELKKLKSTEIEKEGVCSLFNMKWVWDLNELNAQITNFNVSYPQGSTSGGNFARNFTSFSTFEDFQNRVDWRRNNHLYEVLLAHQPRHFFALLQWDQVVLKLEYF